MKISNKGYTLVELLVVIVIGTILVGIIPLMTMWTDHCFDMLAQYLQQDVTANIPWFFALLAVLASGGTVLLFNLGMTIWNPEVTQTVALMAENFSQLFC